jgi:3D (Asp-Asp-Asp) domain-containing protein
MGCGNKPEVSPDAVVVEKSMWVTAYCHCEKCTSWTMDSSGRPVFTSGSEKGKRKEIGITASGEYAKKGTIAAPSKYPFGTVMYVPGYGWGTVQDRGGAIKGDKLDLYFKSHKKALEWGRKNMKVTIYLD